MLFNHTLKLKQNTMVITIDQCLLLWLFLDMIAWREIKEVCFGASNVLPLSLDKCI
jgi:hypothetical protein